MTTLREQKRPTARWVLLSLFVLTPALWGRLTPNEYSGGRSRNLEARQTRNASSIAAMLGEFRTSFSDILLIKTERYLHGGVGYVVHADHDRLDTEGTMASLDEHQEEVGEEHHEEEDDLHAGTPTLIPAPSRDYRGIIGRLQRQVKPWRDPSLGHQHSDGRQLLPWFRIATLSDPHHVRSYSIGGYWVSCHDWDEAEKFLMEGIEHNPEAFQLYYSLAQLYMKQARNATDDIFNPSPEAATFLLKARDAYGQAAELAVNQWPRDTSDGSEEWTFYDKFDAWTAFQMAALTEERYGSPEKAKKLAERYLPLIPEDGIIQRIVEEDNKP